MGIDEIRGTKLGKAATVAERDHRRAQALELRLQGMEFRSIAKRLNIAPATAHNDVDLMLSELADTYSKEVVHIRATQTARYTRLLSSVWDKAIGGSLGAVEKAISICSRIDAIHGLSSEKSLAVLNINQHINVQEVTPTQLEEYADIIRGLAALGPHDTAEVDIQAAQPNGHRIRELL